MTKANATDPELGQELFRCRPTSLQVYSSLRFQGAFPAYASLKWMDRVTAVVSPVTENLLLAGLPTILSILILQVILGLKPPHEPVWVRPFCFAILAASVPLSVWWCWIAPRKDRLVVYERGFRWQVSLNHYTWCRSRGSVAFSDLETFSYRSDCFATEPLDTGKATGEKLGRILLELKLARLDAGFHLQSNQDIVVEKLFARFDQDDLQRFLNHLATIAEPHRITL
jgi:hypothetical protein